MIKFRFSGKVLSLSLWFPHWFSLTSHPVFSNPGPTQPHVQWETHYPSWPPIETVSSAGFPSLHNIKFILNIEDPAHMRSITVHHLSYLSPHVFPPYHMSLQSIINDEPMSADPTQSNCDFFKRKYFSYLSYSPRNEDSVWDIAAWSYSVNRITDEYPEQNVSPPCIIESWERTDTQELEAVNQNYW